MSFWHPALVVLTIAFAISLRYSKTLRGYQFTAWIIAAVTTAMIYPANILHIGGAFFVNRVDCVERNSLSLRVRDVGRPLVFAI